MSATATDWRVVGRNTLGAVRLVLAWPLRFSAWCFVGCAAVALLLMQIFAALADIVEGCE